MQLQRALAQPLVVDSSIRIVLLGFDTSDMMNPDRPKDRLKLGAQLEIQRGDSSFQTTLYSTFIMGGQGETQYAPFQIPGTTYFLALQRAMPNMEDRAQSKAIIMVSDTRNPATTPREVFTIEVSIKPFINLVWGGVLFMVGGFFVSIVRRRKELFREDSARANKELEDGIQPVHSSLAEEQQQEQA